MPQKIVIEGKGLLLEAELSDAPAARAVAAALPLSPRMSRWGEEYYGSVDLDIADDGSGRELMSIGEIAWWPPGKALCIFFGRTPVSTDERPRAASTVLPVGRVTAGLGGLRALGGSISLTFRRA